ncbi:chemosensory receptor c [Plakobranchus ocellatus]|uniref:Chemosensory receptor c n=1 Tax=Plakobranchus ocellatus TaxID=259542 RepID=A0AAV3XV17_9GAST|nr:chemosensory receptor c [Plakobranchus ocellatus]
MATNNSIEVGIQVAFPKQILSSELYPYLNSFLCILTLMFSMPAICFNAVNVFIFCKIGVTDSITVCFLHLAVCDFCTMVAQSVGAYFTLFFILNVPGSENFSTYTFATATTYSLFLDVASATITYIALQRGLCVAWPFLARHAFTRNRSLLVLITITVILVGSGMPRAVNYRFTEIPDPTSNSSQIMIVHFSDIYDHLDAFYLIFVKIFMGFTQYIIMSVCAVAIFIGMTSSMRLKSTSSSAGSDSQANQESVEKSENAEGNDKKTDENPKVINSETKKEKDKKAPQKELLVIKQALTVVLLQIFCTTPGIIVFLYSMFEPRFQIGTEYHNLFFVVFASVDVISPKIENIEFFYLPKTPPIITTSPVIWSHSEKGQKARSDFSPNEYCHSSQEFSQLINGFALQCEILRKPQMKL